MGFKICYDLLSRLKTIKSYIFPSVFIDFSIRSQNDQKVKSGSFPYFKIIGIMCWSHLHNTSSKIHFHIGISNNRNLSTCQWHDHFLTNEVLVSAIIRMHRNSRIPKQGFRSGRGKDQAFIRSYNWITNLSKISLLVCHFYFIIGKCSSATRTSIDHIFSLIDQSIIIEIYKMFFHRLREPLIHGKTLSSSV